MKLVYLMENDHEQLKNAERVLSECMELADLIARENREFSREWSDAFGALYVVKNLIAAYERDESPTTAWNPPDLPFS